MGSAGHQYKHLDRDGLFDRPSDNGHQHRKHGRRAGPSEHATFSCRPPLAANSIRRIAIAADYIQITRTNRPQLGSQLIRAANLTKELRELVDGLNDIGSHQFDGGDYSMFEAQFGVPTGQGANALNLLGLINTIYNTNGDVTGASRLAQLDEFVGRLAGQ